MDHTNHFPLDPQLIYLNHAAVSPWPKRTADAIRQFATENETLGSSHYPQWLEIEDKLRQHLSTLIGVGTTEDIALLKSTSEGLSVVAHGLPWSEGENVVTSDQEFPSNSMVWESLSRYGVTTRKVDLQSNKTPEEALFAAVDQNTRLLSISSVQFGDGLCMDLERIGAFCRSHNILFCVDAIQSLGALQFDGEAIQADFIVADGHKWMMAPEGCALFYSSPTAREQLQLHQFGWHMREIPHNFDADCEQPGCCNSATHWTIASSARRFEAGSPNMLGIHGLEASLSLLLEVGMRSVEQRLLERTELLIEQVEQHPKLTRITPTARERHAGITTFALNEHDPVAVQQQLQQEQIQCAVRGGGIRFSPHFYTPVEQIIQALETLSNLIKT